MERIVTNILLFTPPARAEMSQCDLAIVHRPAVQSVRGT